MVLLVEDDEDIRESIAELLRRRGYDVVTAADGHDALSVLARGDRPCIVLLDLVMPRMDGWTFLDRVHADPANAEIPVVIVSAHGGTHAPAGTAGVLRKPFELDDLFRVVADYCGLAMS